MIFYNGFNLMVDVILMAVAGGFAYKLGWLTGFGQGEEHYREHAERAGSHYVSNAKEFFDQEVDN